VYIQDPSNKSFLSIQAWWWFLQKNKKKAWWLFANNKIRHRHLHHFRVIII